MVSGIGNALLAVPMVRQLKRLMPACHISIIARMTAMADVFERLPEVDQVLVSGGGLAGHLRSALWTGRLRPDVYVVPFPSNRWQYSALAVVSRARCVAMHSYPVGRWRAMHVVAPRLLAAERGIHDVVQNLRLLTLLGLSPDYSDAPVFPLSQDERLGAAARLAELGLSPQDQPIVVHAGSGKTVVGRAKRWPTAKYAELILTMQRELSHPIVLVEGPDEAGVADEIAAAVEKRRGSEASSRPLIVKLNGPLGAAAALLERARLYVGSDSGLAHVAAAVGTPAVTLFAPADPDRVCPYGSRDLVVQPLKDCTPCLRYPWQTPYPQTRCAEPFCIGEIAVEAVLAAVRRALASDPPAERRAARGAVQART
jgi:ADP-heptose:LPS heptosyltransferase